jgi:tRNA pseudouridine55 synthase
VIPDGVVVLDKPSGATSHQLVGRLRRVLGIRKIGHAGTLDPMATGVLILGVGRATRLLGHLALHDKRYLATVRLGERSDSDDADGLIEPVADASGLTSADIERAAEPLRGEIQQVPSTVSAIKVDGKRAYALAREGKTVELKPRTVTVSRLDVIDVRADGARLDVDIDVECSSGTYIRAIARDMGAALGVGGHLTRLRRTRIGNYDIGDAVVLGDEPPVLMTMADAARRSFPVVELDAAQTEAVRYGRALDIAVPGPVAGLLSPGGQLLALYRPEGSGAAPMTVLVGPDDEIALG